MLNDHLQLNPGVRQPPSSTTSPALPPQFQAQVEWIPAEQDGLRALPDVRRLIHPAHLVEDGAVWPTAEPWSIVLAFDVPPSVQGDPSTGRVSFGMDNAPHERLWPGRRQPLDVARGSEPVMR